MELALKHKPAGDPAQPKKRRRPKKKTLIFLAVGLVTLAALGVVVWKLFLTEASAAVLTGTTTTGSLAKTIEGTGITVPAESYTYSTASDTEILQVAVSAGDTVKKGDLLYVQDDSEVDDTIEEYQDEIAQNEDSLSGYQEQLAELREEMGELTVTAPFAGRLQDVKVETGDTVKSGDVLCTIVDDSKMTLTQYFSYAYEDQIWEGMAAVVSIPDLMTSFDGTVTEIRKVERVTPEGTRCFAVTVTVENPGALAQDMSAGGYLVSGTEKLYPAVEGVLENAGEKTITAKGNGELLTVNAEDYQRVSAGERLFLIDDSDYQTQIKNLNTQIERAQDKINAANKKIVEAEESRANYRVTSDIDGKVIMVMVREGDIPTKGRTAVAVYDLTTMSITASIDELDIDYLSAGMPVQIVRSGAETNEIYEGTITEVGLEATSSGGVATFAVEITIDSDGALSSGVNVSYYIDVGEDTGEGVLAPVAAVQYTDEGTCLFVQADARPENAVDLADGVVPDGFYAVPVEVGTSSGRQVRILSGAEEGMTVFLGYQQAAPSGGDTTSQGGESQAVVGVQMMPGEFSGGMPGFSTGGGGGGMGRDMGGGRPGQ